MLLLKPLSRSWSVWCGCGERCVACGVVWVCNVRVWCGVVWCDTLKNVHVHIHNVAVYAGNTPHALSTWAFCWHTRKRFKNRDRPHVPSTVLRCPPRSVRLRLAQLVLDHITLLVFVLISVCCVDKLDIVHQKFPTKEKRLHFHLSNGDALGCAVFDAPCHGATVEETEQDEDDNHIENFVAFPIRVWKVLSFLMGEPYFIFVKRCQNTSTNTSTIEDDLLKLLGVPEDAQTWTRFDTRAKTYRTTSSSGPLWENVIARNHDR